MRPLALAFFSVFFVVGCVGVPIPIGHDDDLSFATPDLSVAAPDLSVAPPDLSVAPPDLSTCSCHLPNASSTCAHGACTIVSCDAGYGDCNHSAVDGCEVALLTDVNNCGSCGTSCAVHDTCVAGVCTPPAATCHDGIKNGHETDVDCGGPTCPPCVAGQVCAADTDCPHGEVCVAGVCTAACVCNPPNGVGQCVNNQCALTTCNHGFGDCNGNVADGCEVNLASDLNNCGACGTVCGVGEGCVNGACTMANQCTCAPSNGTGHCVNNVCTIGVCNAGFADCNQSAADGCEVAVSTDVNNCGHCGLKCSTNNIAPHCIAGVCTGTCAAGFADCNGNRQLDGCEVNVTNDVNNCGACGVICGPGKGCVHGACI